MFFLRSLSRPAALLAFALVPFLFACSNGGGTPPATQPGASAKLLKPADCSQLEAKLKTELTKVYQRQQIGYYYAGLRNDGSMFPQSLTSPPVTVAGSLQAAAGSGTASSHSDTNVQEKGVDEGDLVKTDGDYIYLARGSHFFVLKAQPADQTAIVTDIDLHDSINEIYLANGRVSVITSSYVPAAVPGGAAPISALVRQRSFTHLYFYDVAEPASPALAAKYDFPGSMQGTRRIGATIYLVTNMTIDLPNPVTAWDYVTGPITDWNAFNEAYAKATAENLQRIEVLSLADLLPTYSRTVYANGVAGATSVAPAVDCGDVAMPESGNGTDLSLVFTVDTALPAPAVASSGVMSSWCSVYMSLDSLYLISGNNWSWIEPVAGAVNPPENPEPASSVHKFSLAGGTGKPIYRGSATVNGWVTNQFSMSEYNGYLRIGTTRGGWWGEGISNQLAILGERDGTLFQAGKIAGIAPGEKIYSIRFDRDRGYMVTFRQIDPLFTFDLSDPVNPRKVGEVAVDGVATYLQVIGENSDRLLTIGQSADANGHVTGNKLQLFDVTNLAAPALLASYELGSGWSDALYDYHAFLYYQPLGLLTIPYYAYSASVGAYSSGLRVFSVSANGIAQRGLIPSQPAITDGSYSDSVDRAIIIGTDIYSLAHRTVTVAGAGQLNIEKVVALPEGYLYGPVAVN
jgi:uncharacterized secreted protein with C-terminal beta-propeller domain